MTAMSRYCAVWAAILALVLAVQARGMEGVAFVDMDRVFSEYYKTKRADARLKEQAAELKADREAGIQKLRALEDAFNLARQEAQDQTLSEQARDRKREEAEDKLIELRETENEVRQMEESRRKRIEEQGQRMRQRIVDEITEVIEQVAVEGKLSSVIDSSGASLNQVPVFVYHDGSSDITDQVILLLNQNESLEEDLPLDEVSADEDTGDGPAEGPGTE